MREGWQVRKLAELVVAQNGYAFSSSDYAQTGHFVMRIGNVQNGYISTADPKYIRMPDDGSLNRFILSEGDILVSLTGNIGRVGVIKDEHLPAALNQRVAKISIRNNSPATEEFLLLFLGSDWFREELTGAGHGAAQQNVSTKDLLGIEVAVPPLPEQQRIVALLDEAFAGLATAKANAERNLQNARAIFESHLQSVFSQRGEGWVEKKLEEIGRTQTGSTPKTSDHSNYGDFISFVKPGDFKLDGTLDYGKDGLSKTGADGARIVPSGSVLMVCIGATIGKCGYSDRAITTNQQVNALTPSDGSSNRFIYYQMLTESFQRSVIHASGQATLPIINKSKWSSLPLWLPPTAAEQEAIAEEFDALVDETQRLTRLYERKLAALEELKMSLLHQAFNGEL
jgi:type I restriction enzyme S subunit